MLSPGQRQKFELSTLRPFVIPVGDQDPHRVVPRMSLYTPEPSQQCAAAQKKATRRIREHKIKMVSIKLELFNIADRGSYCILIFV